MWKVPRERSGAAWTDEEKDLLASRFDNGMRLADLCDEHERTGNAIVTQLVRMDKITVVGSSYLRSEPVFATFEQLKTL